MEDLNNRESYSLRKTEQLRQWEGVIDKLTVRAEKAVDKNKTDLQHHIIKIRVKKARTEAILRKLQQSDNGNWDLLKGAFEKSWQELRKTFLKASAKPK
jgi:hypothetical protein